MDSDYYVWEKFERLFDFFYFEDSISSLLNYNNLKAFIFFLILLERSLFSANIPHFVLISLFVDLFPSALDVFLETILSISFY